MTKLKESYMCDEAMHHAQVMAELEREEYEFQQTCLPPHKRDGYFEAMADAADMLRKEKKGE